MQDTESTNQTLPGMNPLTAASYNSHTRNEAQVPGIVRIATTGREGFGAGMWVADKNLPLSVGKRFSGGVRTVTRGQRG